MTAQDFDLCLKSALPPRPLEYFDLGADDREPDAGLDGFRH
jgi:hypothetical protein